VSVVLVIGGGSGAEDLAEPAEFLDILENRRFISSVVMVQVVVIIHQLTVVSTTLIVEFPFYFERYLADGSHERKSA